MAYTINGIIQKIGDIESIPYRDKVFQKRELVLDCSYRNQFTGDLERPNYPKFEFTGDHVNDLDAFKSGDIVTVTFVLNGSRSEKNGMVRYFTNVNGYKIEKYQSRTFYKETSVLPDAKDDRPIHPLTYAPADPENDGLPF